MADMHTSCHDVAMQSSDITKVLVDPLLKFTQEHMFVMTSDSAMEYTG